MKVRKKNITQKEPRSIDGISIHGRRLGRPPKKTIEEHIRDGTYRRNKHGPKPKLAILRKPEFKLPSSVIDSTTKKWIRNENDERAVVEGCRFDERYPEYFAKCFQKYLRHSKGRWAGKPFELLDWQRDDVVWPLFGWIGPDGYRRHRYVYIEIPKKNGKSTLASAIGVGLLIFDEEEGSEVYSCAGDKEQSGIVHGEAVNMLEASEELMRLVKINRTNKQITYPDKRSYYRALSKSIEGKEGYNIHGAICDELHIWKGRQVWDALRYGFASRDQPILFVITTAGEDMQSVCREQHDYALGVNNGTIIDSSYMGIIYTVSDEDKWDEKEQWYKANPSLGHTLNIKEFESSFSQLQARPSEEPNFKRRRLNIWCASTQLWLDSADWKNNEVTIDEGEVLKGLECAIGVDLAKTKDTTSLVLAFPNYDNQDNWYLKPFIFLPERRIEEIKHLVVNLPNWVATGDIVTTDGSVTDYDFIIRYVYDWIDQNRINVHSIAFDPYNAEQFTRELADKLMCERFSFGQTISNYAEPTEDFERLVLKGEMHHGGNQCMAWQFSHCLIATDKGGRIKPIRHEKKDIRTIDSCVSSIMAYSRALEIDAGYYDGAGVYV